MNKHADTTEHAGNVFDEFTLSKALENNLYWQLQGAIEILQAFEDDPLEDMDAGIKLSAMLNSARSRRDALAEKLAAAQTRYQAADAALDAHWGKVPSELQPMFSAAHHRPDPGLADADEAGVSA